MRWGDERRSENVEDQRGMSFGGIGLAGGGIGTIVIVVVALLLGVDPRAILQQTSQKAAPTQQSGPVKSTPEEDKLKDFVSAVLGSLDIVFGEVDR